MHMLKAVAEKSMEDVWKDLSLPGAGDRTVFQGQSLHDFLLKERDSVLRLNPGRPSSLSIPPPPDGPSDRKRGRHDNGEDVRKKRMVKNRESASRSRARKQAYTYELEIEVAHLQKENAMLKKQNKELRLAKEAPSVQLLKKPSLQRTLTAPF